MKNASVDLINLRLQREASIANALCSLLYSSLCSENPRLVATALLA
jgi:membrane-associated PAP2 superfamily phosphatase